MKLKTTSMKITLIMVSGILYAIIGYLDVGTFCRRALAVGVVRFWPAVLIPATFGVLFGALVGGLGAVFGIFVTDMYMLSTSNILSPENLLMSITVSLTSNFVGFYLIGYISEKTFNQLRTYLLLGMGSTILSIILSALVVLSREYPVSIPWDYVTQFLPFSLAGYVVAIAFGYVWPEFRSYAAASSIGCALKSTVLGFGIWGISQFNISTIGQFQLPLDIGLLWIVWTYSSEVPFILVVIPPVAKLLYRAFPVLKPQRERGK